MNSWSGRRRTRTISHLIALLRCKLYSESALRILGPAMLHSRGELIYGKSVQDVCRCKPRPPRLKNAVTDLFHVRCVVRVCVDDNFHAMLLRHSQVTIAKIEPIGVGVQLHCDFVT